MKSLNIEVFNSYFLLIKYKFIVKTLEKENLKLKSIIQTFENQKLISSNETFKSLIDKQEQTKSEAFEAFFEKEEVKFNHSSNGSLIEFFGKKMAEEVRAYIQFIDKSFDVILENITPNHNYGIILNIDNPIKITYNDYKRYSKMQKYEKIEFK